MTFREKVLFILSVVVGVYLITLVAIPAVRLVEIWAEYVRTW